MKGHRKRFNANWVEEKNVQVFYWFSENRMWKGRVPALKHHDDESLKFQDHSLLFGSYLVYFPGGVPWAGDVQRGQLVHQRCAASVLDGKPSGGQDDDYNVNIADDSNNHDHKNKADNVFLSRVVTTRSECERSATTLSPSPTRRSKPHVRSPFCFF